jgi:4-hydroxybenzoate polyprenyltransferase
VPDNLSRKNLSRKEAVEWAIFRTILSLASAFTIAATAAAAAPPAITITSSTGFTGRCL